MDDYRIGYIDGVASRDAEVAEYMLERTIRKATEQSNIKLIAERDQLREQVTLLRNTLQRIANRFDLGNGKCGGASEQLTYNEATEALTATEPRSTK